jgi:hypothetical protein
LYPSCVEILLAFVAVIFEMTVDVNVTTVHILEMFSISLPAIRASRIAVLRVVHAWILYPIEAELAN